MSDEIKVPSFLGPLVSLKAVRTSALGGKAPSSASINFRMQRQLQSNWCWAATSTSVSHYFEQASSWTQCKVADATLQANDCCGGGANGHCNIPYYLDDALATTGNFLAFVPGKQALTEVQKEIAAGRPLCIRVGWVGDGGHFLSIIGWMVAASGITYFTLADPIYGVSTVTMDTLDGTYQGSGEWSHSYFVHSVGGGAIASASAPPRRADTMGA
jgi:hypothetical protein